MKYLIAVIGLALTLLTGTVSAQQTKGSQQLMTSSVQGHSKFLKSSVQSLGFVGSHEIVLAKSASIYGPNLSVLMSYDKATDTITCLAASGVPGIAGTVVEGGAEAGAAYLFGSKIRPSNSSTTTGATTVQTSAEGGSATASGSGTATGGSSTGGKFTPPGLIDNPGHSKH